MKKRCLFCQYFTKKPLNCLTNYLLTSKNMESKAFEKNKFEMYCSSCGVRCACVTNIARILCIHERKHYTLTAEYSDCQLWRNNDWQRNQVVSDRNRCLRAWLNTDAKMGFASLSQVTKRHRGLSGIPLFFLSTCSNQAFIKCAPITNWLIWAPLVLLYYIPLVIFWVHSQCNA